MAAKTISRKGSPAGGLRVSGASLREVCARVTTPLAAFAIVEVSLFERIDVCNYALIVICFFICVCDAISLYQHFDLLSRAAVCIFVINIVHVLCPSFFGSYLNYSTNDRKITVAPLIVGAANAKATTTLFST